MPEPRLTLEQDSDTAFILESMPQSLANKSNIKFETGPALAKGDRESTEDGAKPSSLPNVENKSNSLERAEAQPVKEPLLTSPPPTTASDEQKEDPVGQNKSNDTIVPDEVKPPQKIELKDKWLQ